MQQDTLNAHLHIRGAVESDAIKRSCEKCASKSAAHCHCNMVIISDDLKAKCRKARARFQDSKSEASATKEDFEQKSVEKRNIVKEKEKMRIEKLKIELKKQTQFGPSKMFEPIYCDGDVTKEKSDESKKYEGKAASKDSKKKTVKSKGGISRKAAKDPNK